MLQVARLAPNLLQEAAERVVEFVRGQLNDDGGARDRAGNSDLYYTVFTLENLIALHEDVPTGRVRPYLESFGEGDGLDLVHLTCLARCWSTLGAGALDRATASAISDRIEAHRAKDGGYAPVPDADDGTVYHGFLACGARQDLGMPVPDPTRLTDAVGSLALDSGAFANQRGIPAATTPTTAAAVTLLSRLGAPVPERSSAWLLERAHPEGGFAASEGAPIPDLLSTATALHALAAIKTPVDRIKEPSLDFLDTLWTGKAFCGSWADDAEDCEYVYYALLSLGHLSLA